MLMIETTTARRTPARTPASCRLCAAVTKISVAGCWPGRRARGRVDDDLGPGQGRVKSRASDDAHAGRARYRHDLVAAFGKNLADVPPESSGRPGNCDLHDVLLHDGVVTAMTEHRRVR
jgi:hypothetical protein